MAAATSFKAISVISFVAAVLSASTAFAQDAPVAAPVGMDSGFGYAVSVSGLILCASMVLSALVLIKH